MKVSAQGIEYSFTIFPTDHGDFPMYMSDIPAPAITGHGPDSTDGLWFNILFGKIGCRFMAKET